MDPRLRYKALTGTRRPLDGKGRRGLLVPRIFVKMSACMLGSGESCNLDQKACFADGIVWTDNNEDWCRLRMEVREDVESKSLLGPMEHGKDEDCGFTS